MTWQTPKVTALPRVAAQMITPAAPPAAVHSNAAEGRQRALSASLGDLPMDRTKAKRPIRTTLNPSSSLRGARASEPNSRRGSTLAKGFPTDPRTDTETAVMKVPVNPMNPMATRITKNGLSISAPTPVANASLAAATGLFCCVAPYANMPA